MFSSTSMAKDTMAAASRWFDLSDGGQGGTAAGLFGQNHCTEVEGNAKLTPERSPRFVRSVTRS